MNSFRAALPRLHRAPLGRTVFERVPGMAGGLLLAALVFVLFAARVNAAPTISLKNGKTLEVASVSKQGGMVSIVTSSGMKLSFPESQFLSPVENWLAASKEAEQQGRLGEALEYLRVTAMWDPSKKDPVHEASIEAKIRGGITGQFQTELSGGKYSAAAETYKKLAKSSPGGAPGECKAALAQLLAKAKQAMTKGQFDDAENLYKGYLVVVPGSPEANQALAAIGKTRENATFDQRLQKAAKLVEAKQFDPARRMLLALEGERPDDALIKSKLQDLEKAALEDRLEGLLNKARFALGRDDPETCQALCSQLLEAKPGHPEVAKLLENIAQLRAAFLAAFTKDPSKPVICKKRSDQTYFLFLPPKYDAKTPAAIIYVFDASGGEDGAIGRLIFGVASKQGWIVAQSRNSRNGPWQPILDAQDAVLQDTSLRLNLHPTRRFSTGFSGGGRASLAMAFRYPGKITGSMPMGAVWPINTPLEPSTNRLAVCVLMGASDGNLESVPGDLQKLQRAGIKATLVTYQAGHEWPSALVVENGFKWLLNNAP